MKKCKDCNSLKDVSEFYGMQGECKDCTKKRVRLREEKLKLNPLYLEKERARQREKYRRLNYRHKQKEWDAKKGWKKTSKYKNLSRNLKTEKGIELHHWNYNDDYLEDVFFMKTSSHRKAHKYLTLDEKSRCFISDKGELLDTKEKHLFFLKSKGIIFEKHLEDK